MAIRTTTYLCRSDRCCTCGSVRTSRAVGEYQKYDDGSERLINCSDCHQKVTCECGAVYPRHSRSVNASSVNGKANGCVKCKKSEREREIAKAKARCLLKLARHIAKARRKRIIYRDVAARYLRRFGGSTFTVQTDVDASETYLENEKGQVLGKVSSLDQYPKGFDDAIVADIPY